MWLLLTLAAAARDKSPTEVVVKVVVHDSQHRPIPTAVVRHPLEMQRHRVNSADGSWQESVLYLPDGSEVHFVPGLKLDLEISAPGHLTQILSYQIKKRRNLIEVALPEIATEATPIEEPTIGFGTDDPREPAGEP